MGSYVHAKSLQPVHGVVALKILGYSAVLVTDTAFCRNKHYHEHADTLGRLDLRRLRLTVDAVLVALLSV